MQGQRPARKHFVPQKDPSSRPARPHCQVCRFCFGGRGWEGGTRRGRGAAPGAEAAAPPALPAPRWKPLPSASCKSTDNFVNLLKD